MPRVIVIANQKGGVGKTTMVANLGAALARLGHSVLMVDMDSQAALSVSFDCDPYKIKPSTYELMVNPNSTFKDINRSVGDNLKIAPANAELVSAEFKLMRTNNRTTKLKSSLKSLHDEIDYVLIDTPPSLGLLTINALAAADELLVPVATSYLSMRGVRGLLEAVWLIKERINPDLSLLGFVPTLYRAESKHANDVVAEIRRVFRKKVSQSVIPLDETAAAAPAVRKTVFDLDPESASAVAYMKLAEEVSSVRR